MSSNCSKPIHLWWLLVCVSFFLAWSNQAIAEQSVAFKCLSESIGSSLAKAGTLDPYEKDIIINVAVIVDSDGTAFPIYIQDNPKAVIEIREQLRRFDKFAFQAALVGTPDYSILFYAPLSKLQDISGIKVVNFLQPEANSRTRLAKDYVHHKAGGHALKPGVVSASDELPERIQVPKYAESGALPCAKPSRAHFMVAYGDTQGALRAIYLDAKDLVPLLQTILKHTDAPELHSLLAWASYLAGKSNGTYAPLAVVIVLALLALAVLLFWFYYWNRRPCTDSSVYRGT